MRSRVCLFCIKRSMEAVSARVVAVEWAGNVDLSEVQMVDRTYIQAVLAEASLFERPAPELVVSILPCGEHYDVTVKGYERLMDDCSWVEIFLGSDRSENLGHVIGLYTQMTEEGGVIKVIQVQKVKFHHANTDDLRVRRRRGRK